MDYGFADLTDSKSIKSVIYGFWNGFGKILKSVPKSVNYGFFTDLEKFSKSVLKSVNYGFGFNIK